MQKKILGEMFYYLIHSKVYSFSALMSFYTIKIIVKMLKCEISSLYLCVCILTYMLHICYLCLVQCCVSV